MGMTGREILTKVEIPIALPLIISGLRSATLQIVSTATIAALVSLGGLGRYVVDGLKLRDFPQMFTGALLVALLAIGSTRSSR
jgi:osmoprotectant transport system permease protein